ncbi:MAG: hypothetical protein ACXV8O_16115 [Methylobacter sp.]
MRKLLLLLLAFVWGCVVYALHQNIGYEKGTGHPSVISSLGWAFGAALPLFIGPFVTDLQDETQKFNRWFCVAWLAVQAAFLIILSWLKIFGFIPLLGIGLILWSQDEQSEQTENKQQVKYYTNHKITVLLIIGLLYWWHYNPLPSDEEMIAHFNSHRTEIEELVKRYRDWRPLVEAPIWEDLSGNKPLMEKARVKRVTDSGPAWFPNPYSKEASKQFDDLLMAGKIPSLNPYTNITVELLDEDDPDRHFARVLTSSGKRWIFKDLVFIPAVVKIEDGYLLLPARPLCKCRFDEITPKDRIFPSLDSYPPNWKKGECVYRQIETHWFIEMCAAVV